MSIYSAHPITLGTVHTYPLASRKSKVSVRDFARPSAANTSLTKFLDSLPNILAADDLRHLLAAIHSARKQRKAILWGLGGHVIKVGLGPVLIDLMKRGFISGIAMHGAADGAALGAATHYDFRLFCALVEQMHPGGVYLNWGSAVLLPEVFLKAVSVVRNLGVPLRPITTANFDFIQHYRPLHNVVKRPTASARGGSGSESHGYAITGHHELLLPLVAAALAAGWPKNRAQENDDSLRRPSVQAARSESRTSFFR